VPSPVRRYRQYHRRIQRRRRPDHLL